MLGTAAVERPPGSPAPRRARARWAGAARGGRASRPAWGRVKVSHSTRTARWYAASVLLLSPANSRARNFLMQLMVDDLDAWWNCLVALDRPARLGVPVPRPPALQPWGLRVSYVVDLCGVLWDVAERRSGCSWDWWCRLATYSSRKRNRRFH